MLPKDWERRNGVFQADLGDEPPEVIYHLSCQ